MLIFITQKYSNNILLLNREKIKKVREREKKE